MGRVFFLLVVLIIGHLLRRYDIVNKSHVEYLNKSIIFFFIPLITLLNIPDLVLQRELFWLMISPFIVFIVGWWFYTMTGRLCGMDSDSIHALILTGGISSTSFVGFPVFELLYGEIGLTYGVLMSLGGTILVFNTLGMALLLRYSQHSFSMSAILKRMFTFLPFLVFVFSLSLNLLDLSLPVMAKEVIAFLVSPFSLVALLAVGMQVQLKSFHRLKTKLLIGQLYKLFLAPVMIFLVGRLFYEPDNLIFRIGVLGAGIGSMNAISIMTAQKKIKPDLAIAMPATGIPISVFTLFIIYYFIG